MPDPIIVHIAVDLADSATYESREAFLIKLSQFGFVCTNIKRFERYGIATGHVLPEMIDTLSKAEGVESVEVDGQKYAT